MLLNKQKNGFFITVLVIMLTITGMLSTDIYVPSLPVITHALQTTPAFTKLTITMYLLGFCLSPLLFGHISDRYGRKPILILFSSIALIGIVLAALANNIDQLILGRIIQGIGFGVTTSLGRAIFVDIFTGTQLAQMVALISFFFGISPAAAPVLGSYIQLFFGWQAIFIFLGVYLALMMLLVAVKVPETIHQKNHHATNLKTAFSNYRTLLSHKNFIGYVVSSSMAFGSAIIFYNLSPFILQNHYNLSVVDYGWVIGAITFMMMVSRLINIPLLKYIHANQVILCGLFAMLLASCALVIVATLKLHLLIFIIISMMLFMLGSSIIYSNATANALGPFRHIGGIAAALYGSIQAFGAFIAGMIASILPDNLLSLGVPLLVLTLIALTVFWKTCMAKPALADVVRIPEDA